MPWFGLGQKEKTLEELQAENESLKVKDQNAGLSLSIAQKRLAMQKMKEAGLHMSDFGGSWEKLWHWFKTH